MKVNAKNSNLASAKKAKNDEFYTRIEDIEKELVHYREHFRDKIVLCNCDDPTWSDFWKYFHLNFKQLGLKKLISTHYDEKESTYKMEYLGGNDNDIGAGKKTLLKSNGDFRCPECIEPLKEADIVVTNPPFSLFREYVAQLMKYEKKFIAIGNMNAITYKEIFPLIKENRLWLGYTSPKEFIQPDGNIKKFGNILWYTNLDIKKRHEDMILYKEYTPEEYPKYDNYDAINVDKVAEIPKDYYEAIGVPITFLDKYNPEQFQILNANDFRVSDSVAIKPHGLIKDKEAAITLDKPMSAAKKRLGSQSVSQNNVCKSSHQENCLHQELMDGISMARENMRESSYAGDKYFLPIDSSRFTIKEIIDELAIMLSCDESELEYRNGIMGVPITFLDKYNPEQFEIVAFRKGEDGKDLVFTRERERVQPYFRMLVRPRLQG